MTRFAIENNRVTIAALVVIFLGGLAAYKDLPRNEDPGFIIRTAQVLTIFPGASRNSFASHFRSLWFAAPSMGAAVRRTRNRVSRTPSRASRLAPGWTRT